jgi:hypothetical protein
VAKTGINLVKQHDFANKAIRTRFLHCDKNQNVVPAIQAHKYLIKIDNSLIKIFSL